MDRGGSFALLRIVGLARAVEITAFDEPISSVKAFECGLVTKVVSNSEFQAEAIAMLDDLSKRSFHSFMWSMRLFQESFDKILETQLELERQPISNSASHPDGQEGRKAFVEKRKPVF